MIQNAYTVRNEDFIKSIDVVCPKCHFKATVLGGKPYTNSGDYENDVAFSCTKCGYILKYTDTSKSSVQRNNMGNVIITRVLFPNNPIDPFFGFNVWYCIETKHGLLWAYNLAHLNVIQNYVADKLRSRNGIPYKNNSIGSRLPQWVKDAKNRDYVLKIIAKLKLK